MKARLVLNENNEKLLLCADGSILAPDNENLLFIFSDFRGISPLSGNDGSWSSYCKDMALYPGETLAYVSDDLSLVITEPSFLRALVSPDFDTETYIGLVEYGVAVNFDEVSMNISYGPTSNSLGVYTESFGLDIFSDVEKAGIKLSSSADAKNFVLEDYTEYYIRPIPTALAVVAIACLGPYAAAALLATISPQLVGG